MAGARHWAQTSGGFRPERSLPLSDRGFRYGMAVFETMRVDRGRVFFLDEHLASLREACRAAAFPADLTGLRAFLQQGEGMTGGVVRAHVTAGDGAPSDPALACRVYVSFEPREESVAPCRLVCLEQEHRPFMGGRKTHNYWAQAAALRAARAAGADDALLFDRHGSLISAAMGNVFAVTADGELVTPPTSLDARNGILRAWVGGRRAVAEKMLDRETLRRAKEVFLTNSWIGIRSAESLDDRQLPGRTIADALRSELQAYYDALRQ